MKRLVSCILALIMMLPVISVHAETVDTSAQAYVLYCPDNGEVLMSDHSDDELPMASTTKIMTTILTLEEAAADNRTVEFTDEMTAQGSSMYLKIGEKVTLYDLAVGMMMQSGNDAANAAAIAIAGSTKAFCDLMNRKARDIGMKHTHFVTPSGLDDEGHYSSAYDMALLMAYAMQNEDFCHITAQTSMEVHFIYPADKFITYPNHNKLLRMYDSCIGGKTGYTERAGRCLVTAAKEDGMTLIAVTLNDRDDWDDHIALYEKGFSEYSAVDYGKDMSFSIDVVGGVSDSVRIQADESKGIIPKGAEQPFVKVYKPPFLYAPVKKWESVGAVRYYLDDQLIEEIPLKAAESIDQIKNRRSLLQYIKDVFNWHN